MTSGGNKKWNIPKNTYSATVFVNDWTEDRYRKIDKLGEISEAHKTQTLLVDRLRILNHNLHQDIELSTPKRYIRIGATIQIIPIDMNLCEKPVDVCPALTININERVVKYSDKINADCELFIAPNDKPCVRNTFKIIAAVDECPDPEAPIVKLKYGQYFRIQCIDTVDNLPHYLYVAQKSMELGHMAKPSFVSTNKYGEVNLPVAICRCTDVGPGKMIPSGYCLWKCQHIDHKARYESLGQVLQSNSPVVITHVPTNRSLASENLVANTLLGPEYMVSCQTYDDRFKRTTSQNLWMLHNGKWSDDPTDERNKK